MSSAVIAGMRQRANDLLSVLATSHGFAVTVLLYLGVLFILRIMLFPGASEDDAETLLLAQSLEGGYKPGQPPLYIWLAYGITQLASTALPVVVALKFASLSAIYIFSHRLAKLFTGDGKWAAVAGLSVIGIYYLSWDAVLNYSQTVLLAALALVFVHALVRIAANPTPGWSDYIWLGVVTGAGILTKYNFVLLAATMMLAALLDRDLRGKLLGMRGVAVVLIAAGLVMPHVMWVLDGGMSTEAVEQAVPAASGAFASRLSGLWDMVMAIISVLSPLLILLILFFPRAFASRMMRKAGDRGQGLWRWRLLCERTFWFLMAAMAAAVLVSGVAEVRNHWFIILAPFPAYAVLRLADAYPMAPGEEVSGRIAGFVGVLAVLGVAVTIGVTVRALTLPATCGKCKMVVPYAELASGLRKAGFSGGTIYVHDYPTQVGGNLRRFFPDSRFVSYKFQPYMPPHRSVASGQCLAVWLLGAGEQSPAREGILGQLHQWLEVSPSPDDSVTTIDVAMPGRAEPLTYGYILIDDLARQGNCR